MTAQGRCSAPACTTPRSAPRTSSPSCCPGWAAAGPPRRTRRAGRSAARARGARADRDLRAPTWPDSAGPRSTCRRYSRPGTSPPPRTGSTPCSGARSPAPADHPRRRVRLAPARGRQRRRAVGRMVPHLLRPGVGRAAGRTAGAARRVLPVAFMRAAVRQRGPGQRAPLLLGCLRHPRAGGRAPRGRDSTNQAAAP